MASENVTRGVALVDRRAVYPANRNHMAWTIQEAVKRARRVRFGGVPFGEVRVDPCLESRAAYVLSVARRWVLYISPDVSFAQAAEVLRGIVEKSNANPNLTAEEAL